MELAEVDDDVITLGNRLHRQDTALRAERAIESHSVLQNVAVVRDQVERHRRAVGLHQTELEVTRHATVQETEAVLARTDFHVGLVLPVRQQLVAQEAVRLEVVEPQLAVLVPGLVAQHDVDVVVAVAPREVRTAGQAQVHTVIDRFVAAIEGGVVVHHRRVALVDVLRRVVLHVVMEPVRADGLAPVATDLDDAAVFVRVAGARIGGLGVDRVVTREDHRPTVIPVLAREDEGVREAVTFGRVVAVVLVRRDGVHPEAHVRGRVDRQRVVVAEQDRPAVACLQQLGRDRAVKCPQSTRILDRHVRVDAHVDAIGGAFEARRTDGVVVQTARTELADGVAVALAGVAEAAVAACARLGRLEPVDGLELIPTLVRPTFAGRTRIAGGRVELTAEHLFDARLPRVLEGLFAGLRRLGEEQTAAQEGIEVGAVGAADAVRRTGQAGTGRGARGRNFVGAELFEHQHLLREGLRAEQRRGTAAGGDALVGGCYRGQDRGCDQGGSGRGCHVYLGELVVTWGERRCHERPEEASRSARWVQEKYVPIPVLDQTN